MQVNQQELLKSEIWSRQFEVTEESIFVLQDHKGDFINQKLLVGLLTHLC